MRSVSKGVAGAGGAAGVGGRDGFERFYVAVRDDLLLQTFALTGDLPAAERAVRDSLVVAWHHWRKVARLDDPVAWVRPLAWSKAQRRHTTRWWHRQRDISAGSRATLDALGTLTPTQRRSLLLTTLTAQPLDAIAAEVGLSRPALERELQSSSAQFSLSREASSTAVRALVEGLRSETAASRWPRASILLRAGTTRRRSHTTVGIVAAVAATVVAGSVVTDAAGVAPRLATKGTASIAAPTTAPEPTPTASPEPDGPLENAVLLSPEQLDTSLGGSWTAGETSRNTEGDGLNVTCQRSRYADPQGVGALVRSFSAPTRGRTAASSTRDVVQSVERSADEATAATAYELTRSWYGTCDEPRMQLLATYDVSGAGDAATMLVLRSWAAPASTQVVGVARTGSLTTTVSTSTPGIRAADLDTAAGLLGTAVSGICAAPGGGTCTGTPDTVEADPLPLEEAPAMIGTLDLPPVGRVRAPWAGTAPAAATTNDASTRCDDADFSGPAFTQAATRSFLVPEATRLPPQFGLTETIGSLPVRRARAFVERVRDRMATCSDRDLGTQVTSTADVDSENRSLSTWTLRVEIDDDRFVDYRMAIMRSGTSVAQLGFIAADGADMSAQAFRSLCSRAMQRLDALPPPPA